jgi:hypothetical protein
LHTTRAGEDQNDKKDQKAVDDVHTILIIEMKPKGKGIVIRKVQTNANNCLKFPNQTKKSGCRQNFR